ncbi:MAG TPA: glutamate 5-kinase [Polyangiaceae bacterium]
MKRAELVRGARRIVVKIGSSSLAGEGAVARLAADVAALAREGRAVVLVSSGAIALGYKKLGYKSRPKEMAKLQASAAAGQSLLMHAYENAFGKERLAVAQVLLTHADLADRTRANNARDALAALLDARAIPVLNENDSVAVDEIKFGDNDQLAALVVPLVDADLLVLLSDVQGVLDARGQRVETVADASEAAALVRPSKKGGLGTGGMASKIEAARRATLAGANVVIADARDENVLRRVAAGEDVGTLFVRSEMRLSARRYWIAFTLRPRGDVVLDAGAVRAVRRDNKSVLAVGVLGVRGDFRAGDAVRVLAPEGDEIGRGLVRVAAEDALRLAGTKSDSNVLVHRDELVVW